jgi:hypothetical protein
VVEPPRDGSTEIPSQPIDLTRSSSSGTMFNLHDVIVASEPLPEIDPKSSIEALVGGSIESCSDYRGQMVACRFHPLVEATWAAYDGHRPLTLSPDIIWLTIVQGLAVHINEHAERLRHHFVSHAGKQTLVVVRNDFVKGSPENPWGEVIGEFSGMLADQIGEKHGLIVADFSTTGPVERVASEIVLMDSMRSYFEFEVRTRCGIPSVSLEGSPQDWEKIRARLDGFDELGLDWWTEALRPVLDHFLLAARGTPDREFWRGIFKENDSSGGPYLTGWLVKFFPYLQRDEYEPAPSYKRTGRKLNVRNPYLEAGSDDDFGVSAETLPSGLSRAPFVWDYLGQRYAYEFIAGLVGIEQDRLTMGLRPKIGWAVRAIP